MRRKIGPGNPPRGNRFVKGQSGNPRGRPKQARRLAPSAFDILDRTFTVKDGDVERELPTELALLMRTYQEALAGNRAARREVYRWIVARDKAMAAKGKVAPVATDAGIEHDPDNADDALLLLGIAERDHEREHDKVGRKYLLLEAWAVQMALRRRRGRTRLRADEIELIKRCTSEPKDVVWPRGLD